VVSSFTIFAASQLKMAPVYTVPHELDMLVKAGHIQGAACSEKAIYLSHMLGIVKLDWNGKLLKTMDAPSHLGDIEYANGKIYGAFCVRNAKLCPKGMNGLVRVWDEDLNLLAEKWFPELFDGIAVLGDTVYVGVDRWGRKSHPLCCVKRLGLDLSDKGNVDVDLGYQIKYGVQTMATDGKDLFFGCYGGTAKVSADLKRAEKVELSCSEGLAPVPKAVTKSEAQVFFAVKALGGNMKGWRKDPVNNPPRIRLNFYEWKNGKFTCISDK
jgi:hypothetical protein